MGQGLQEVNWMIPGIIQPEKRSSSRDHEWGDSRWIWQSKLLYFNFFVLLWTTYHLLRCNWPLILSHQNLKTKYTLVRVLHICLNLKKQSPFAHFEKKKQPTPHACILLFAALPHCSILLLEPGVELCVSFVSDEVGPFLRTVMTTSLQRMLTKCWLPLSN